MNNLLSIISVTKDGGKTWKNVTPPKMPKGGRVESVEPSQFNPAKAYVAVDRHLLGDAKPYMYKTSDYGKTWTLISTAGIPIDYTARVLREDPVRPGLLYAGTEYGLFVSFDDGNLWKSFQQNLPVTPVTDLKIFRGDLIVSTMGRSFWILDNITSLRQDEINTLDADPWLFKPDATIRYRYPKIRNSKTAFPKYDETSVTIDYFLPKTHKGNIQLQILDANKSPVIAFVSDSTEQKASKKVIENMDLSQLITLVNTQLSKRPGLNRFHWDLKHKGPWNKNKKRSYKNGPMVAPGKYTARLTVGTQSYNQDFEVKIDPRVKDNGISEADIIQQIKFQNKIVALLTNARKLEESLEKEAKSLKGKKAQVKVKRLANINYTLTLLKNKKGAYPQQMLVSQISYLLNINNNADQIPGQDAVQRIEELTTQFEKIKNEIGM